MVNIFSMPAMQDRDQSQFEKFRNQNQKSIMVYVTTPHLQKGTPIIPPESEDMPNLYDYIRKSLTMKIMETMKQWNLQHRYKQISSWNQ